jgi:hypothetical protein
MARSSLAYVLTHHPLHISLRGLLGIVFFCFSFPFLLEAVYAQFKRDLVSQVGSRDHRTQFWKGAIQESFQQRLVEIGSVVSEEKICF